ncbi:MAG: 23S rRNA (adenine(2503)-C(2))-methyltransferase RlmN [Dehalococcoidales bacterium]|nr:23S rRNA (adenine(2503)-C(2))-methyltransferase RlmN [Dehalococcoidales bacterium]
MSKTIIGLSTDELRALVEQAGEPAYRGNQLAEWIYRREAHTFEEMTNLPLGLRSQLAREYEIGRSRILSVQHGRDTTTKLLLAMSDGARVETVGLPYAGHFSCCVSTQVGCPVGCIFCATGMSGYTRNLTAGEIVEQVLTVQETVRSRQLPAGSHTDRIDHVTFMGMGEPLLNQAATMKAIQLLKNELGIAMRHLTLSTVGFVPGILKLAGEKTQITLAISLHAPNDRLRRKLIPRAIKFSVTEILDACREFVRQTGRRVTLEYCLLNGINDGSREAHELAGVVDGLNCHVNLIPYNAASGLTLHSPPREQIRTFRSILESAGIPVTQRLQRGAGIDAACGQLRNRTI